MHDDRDQYPAKPSTDPATGSPEAAAARPPAVACPFCHSTDTEMLSPFGGQLSTAQYQCRTCRSYFEYMVRDSE
jgi:hypothetical protein